MTPLEELDQAVSNYLADSGVQVGMVSGWVLIGAQQALLDPEEGTTGTQIFCAGKPGLPNFQALGLLETGSTAYRRNIGGMVEAS